MRLKHYHVLVGLPGYMPNSNYPCSTLAEAGDVAYEEAKAFREAGYATDWSKDCLGKVVGNKREGYEVLRRSLWHDGVDGLGTGYSWEVWQTITISPCDMADCQCPKCGALFYEEDCICEECGEARMD